MNFPSLFLTIALNSIDTHFLKCMERLNVHLTERREEEWNLLHQQKDDTDTDMDGKA